MERCRTLGVGEVDDVAVLLEHVDLLDSLDRLSVQLLEGSLELPVVGAGPGGRALRLSPGSTLATRTILSAHHSSSSLPPFCWQHRRNSRDIPCRRC
jgi:hypothetical protein